MPISRCLAVVLVLAAASCGKEAGRVRFTAEGSGEQPLSLTSGEVAFWTDLDVEYEGDASLQYRVELVQDGVSAATAVCDPLGHLPMKTGWVETNIGDSHSRRGSGKMSCSATLVKASPTTVKATLAFDKKPRKATLKKADLVVKQ